MVIVKYTLLILVFTVQLANASEIARQFKFRNYKAVVQEYAGAQKQKYSKIELIKVSYALKAMKMYRQDIAINARLIKEFYAADHKKLVLQIYKDEEIDPDDYPKPLKILYWNIVNDYAFVIKEHSKLSPEAEKDRKAQERFAKLLSAVEFREGKADKIAENMNAHFQHLQNKIFHFVFSLNVQYMSWQREAVLKGPIDTDLVMTNKGYCIGGDMGWQNSYVHFYIDGCYLIGSGGVSAASSSGITYEQSEVTATGFKGGPGVSMIVSSSKSRIGLKLPFVYSMQELTNPPNALFKVDQGSSLSTVAALYSRWQFDKWYFQTEFGKYLQKDLSLWSFGIGRDF